MSCNERYAYAHKLAKLIAFAVVVMCLILNRDLGLVAVDIFAVFVWFFGVNFFAYLIESVLNWEHRHDKF